MTTSWSYGVVASDPPSIVADLYPLVYQGDHAGYAKEVLLAQYAERPRMQAFVESVCRLLQPLEDVCWQLLTDRYLESDDGYDVAIGDLLGGIGKLVIEPRRALTDANYLVFICTKILANKSIGSVVDIDEILTELLDLSTVMENVEIIEIYKKQIEIYASNVRYPNEIFMHLYNAKACGIGLLFVYNYGQYAYSLRMSHTYDAEEYDDNTGLDGSPYESMGGTLAGAIR